jgi:trehalose synthase
VTISLEDYRKVTPPGTIDLLYRLGEKSQGKRLLNINSTRIGGGVAEILQRLVPLMRDVGVLADWEVIQGNPAFYATTKSFHNALQGQEQVVTKEMLDNYLRCNEGPRFGT